MPRNRIAPTTPPEDPGNSTHVKIDVSITATRNYHDSPERARATVTLNNCFVVKGVRVLRGENGLFVSMPARKGQDGRYREVCHPISADFARQLNASVLAEYQVHLARQMEESQSVRHVINPEETFEQSDAPEQDTTEHNEPDQTPSMGM